MLKTLTSQELAMAEAGKANTWGDRHQNTRFPTKPKWRAATSELETVVFGYGASFILDTFSKAYNSLFKYIGSRGLDKHGGPEAAAAL